MPLSTGNVRSPPSYSWFMFLANEFLAGVPHWYSLLDSNCCYIILLEVITFTGPFCIDLFKCSTLPPSIYLLLSILSLTSDSEGCSCCYYSRTCYLETGWFFCINLEFLAFALKLWFWIFICGPCVEDAPLLESWLSFLLFTFTLLLLKFL